MFLERFKNALKSIINLSVGGRISVDLGPAQVCLSLDLLPLKWKMRLDGWADSFGEGCGESGVSFRLGPFDGYLSYDWDLS